MERALKEPVPAKFVSLSPSAEGWRVSYTNGARHVGNAATLGEAAQGMPADQPVHLALPSRLVLVERLRLPAIDPEELGGMVRLQLEKTLPYAVEDTSSDFEVIEQTETESVLLAMAINNAQLDEMCRPLREQARLPDKITVFAAHIAQSCPTDQTVLLLFKEEGQLLLAIAENGKLGFMQALASTDPDAVAEDLPQTILSAELEGVPTSFTLARIDEACWELAPMVGQLFGLPVEAMSLDEPLREPAGNLLPESWQQERRQIERKSQLKSRLVLAGILYALLLIAAFAYVFWMQSRVNRLNGRLLSAQPQVEAIRARQSRWTALAPAIDRNRYIVEVLLHVQKAVPSEAVRVTVFSQSLAQFTIRGEAPNVPAAAEFGEKLKNNPELSSTYKLVVGKPTFINNNEKVQFDIIGKP